MPTSLQPTVGCTVHYVSYGSPGGEFGKECRAAIVTEVAPEGGRLLLDAPFTQPHGSDELVVGLCVLNPSGIFFHRAAYHDGAGEPGDPDCPSRETHGDPLRYCTCGWTEPSYPGGTWHWPEGSAVPRTGKTLNEVRADFGLPPRQMEGS